MSSVMGPTTSQLPEGKVSRRGGPPRVTQQLGDRAAGEWPETITRGVHDDTVPSCHGQVISSPNYDQLIRWANADRVLSTVPGVVRSPQM